MSTEKNIVTLAVKFEESSCLLDFETNKLQNNNPLISKTDKNNYLEPALMCCAFSFELYLKAIYYHENKKKISGHNILDLFNKLSFESQNSIENYYKKYFEEHINANKWYKENFNIPSLDFNESIKEISEVFVSIRYIYENPLLEKNLFFRNLLRNAFVNRINELDFYDETLE